LDHLKPILMNYRRELIVDNELRLKEIGLEDVDSIYRTVVNEREYLGKWLPFVSITNKRSDSQAFVQSIINSGKKNFICTIFFQQMFVGLIGLKDIDSFNKKSEIGYWLSEAFQQKGIIARSSKAIIDYAFDELCLNRIQIKVATGNLKSLRVAERLGFTCEGIERQGELLDNGYADLIVFGLLKNERLII